MTVALPDEERLGTRGKLDNILLVHKGMTLGFPALPAPP